MKEERVEIRALKNASAENQLVNALEKIEGVKCASIDHEGDTVKVSYSSPASAQQIRHCIRGSGNSLK